MQSSVQGNNDGFDHNHAKVRAFRDALRSTDDADKFQACKAMRDELLEQQTELEWLFACIEEVMLQECPQYEQAKSRWSNNHDEAAKWERFVGVVKSGADLRKQCLAPLTKASGFWGIEKVQHYEWGSMGWKYCKLLGTAATRSPSWEEAIVKLNQILVMRIANGSLLKVSPNPVTQIDLEHLGSWRDKCDFTKTGKNGFTLPYQPILLPGGYAYDQYGLIISAKATCPSDPAAEVQSSMAQSKPSSPVSDDATVTSPSIGATSNSSTSLPASPTSPTRSASSLSEATPSADSPTSSSTPETHESIALAPLVKPPYATRKSNRVRPVLSYQEASVQGAKSNTQMPSTRPSKGNQYSSSSGSRTCVCSNTVAPEFLSAIECNQPPTAADVEVAVKYAVQRSQLCKKHLERYASWATIGMLYRQEPSRKRPMSACDLPTKRRRLSLPELGQPSNPSATDSQSQDPLATAMRESLSDICNGRPVHDTMGDAIFRELVLSQLDRKRIQGSPTTWGQLNNQVMYKLLSKARQPVIAGTDDEIEAYYLTGEEAEARLNPGILFHGPVITEKQQPFKWDQSKGRPIQQLFRRLGSLERTVSVQNPSLSLQKGSCVKMQLGDVQDAFLKNEKSTDSLNVLELRSPLPRSILPSFLTGEDCQLLGQVRDAVLDGESGERRGASVEEWNRWKDVEDWVLLAQGGAQTLLHQDSCGKATWLTVQQGRVGFGWISRPTEEEIRSWSVSPNDYAGDRLRYVVLDPDQTIYFEAGTIHFVFRQVEHPTLMLGGHILRWSRVDSWIEIVLHQLRFPNTTNEDLLPSAAVYVETLAKLVLDQQRQNRTEELGGEKAVARFFALKKEFEQHCRRHRFPAS